MLLFNAVLKAQQSDNGDGTYTNPVIPADFPDPDVIRVDSVYYYVSTTMFIFPGVTILKSYDLVNWEYCANAVQRFDFDPCYNLDGCDRYSHGQWATSLKHHNDTFYLLFITLDEGGFLCSSPDPEGPWKIRHLPRGFYDPGLFFDDDDKIYVAHGNSDIYITELDSNFVAKGADSLVHSGTLGSGLEGVHVYKINGFYYLYCTYPGPLGREVALRADNIYGPYEERTVIYDNTPGVNYGIHQGALIQTQTGEWWTMLFVDMGAFGRFPSLQPVTWVDDWPIAGVDGKGVITHPKPDVGTEYPISILPTSDEFEDTELGMQWGWNHNPDSTKWSLTENPGYLRLSTVKSVTSLTEARNTLTQRIFAYYSDVVSSTATIKMHIDSMQNGDIAGIAVFQDPYAYLGVRKKDGINHLVMVNDGDIIDSIQTDSSNIYLKANANYGRSQALFAYSFDDQTYTILGDELEMQFDLSVFTGNKFCLFNYATVDTGGYVDFDWFRTDSCGKTVCNTHLRVNDGILLDTNETTINLGDSVLLIPEAFGSGAWKWSGWGLSGSADSQMIYPETTCVITVSFTNICGVKTILKYRINVNTTEAVERKITNSDIKIIPNPVQSEFQVLNDFAFNELAIYSMDGKQIIDQNYNIPLKSVNLSIALDSGLYFLVLKNNTSVAITRFVHR